MIAARMRSACNVCTDAILLARTFHDEALRYRVRFTTPAFLGNANRAATRLHRAGGFPKLDGNCLHREFVTSVRRLGFPCAPAAAGPLRPAARQRAVLRNTKYWTASPSRRRLPPAAAWRISVRAWSPASASWPSASGPMPPTDSTSWGLPDTVCVLGLRLRSARISKTAARTRPRSCATLCQDLRGALSADSCHHVRRWPCDLPLRSRLGG